MLPPGHIFAHRYRIGRLLGSGGMGEVYEARHTLTEHEVALKCLRPADHTAPHEKRSFELEARVDARVNSDHIVRVQDAGVDEATGSPYLVMELLRGSTLAELIKRQKHGRLRVDQTLDILGQVARGLDAAHAYGIVHRDLKPENVFLTNAGAAKILDFGIAKLLDASEHVTQELRGTPLYMAAEQANGARVCVQTDVWALGLMAYRALTGRVYWRCAAEAASEPPRLAQIIYEITVSRQDPPSVRLAQLGASVRLPSAFDAWLLRCIDRVPTRRFESASAAVQALESVFEGEPRDALQPAAPTDAAPPSLRQVTPRTRTYEDATVHEIAEVPSNIPAESRTRGRARSARALRLGLLALLACGVISIPATPPLLQRGEVAPTRITPNAEAQRDEQRVLQVVSSRLEVAASPPSSAPAVAPRGPTSADESAPPAPAPAATSGTAIRAGAPRQRLRRQSSPAPAAAQNVQAAAPPEAPRAVDLYGIAPLELAGKRQPSLTRREPPAAAEAVSTASDTE